MDRVLSWVCPRDERRMVGWFALAGAFTSLFGATLVYAAPYAEEATAFWLPGDTWFWLSGAVIVGAAAIYLFVRLARRRGAPVSIWLVPAFAAAWIIVGPVLDLVVQPGLQTASVLGFWWNAVPAVAVLIPALIATLQERPVGERLLPSDEKRDALAIAGLAAALFLANKVAFTSPTWAASWLPSWRDDEMLGYQLLLVTAMPLVICFIAVLVFRVPRSAWMVPSASALAIAFAVGLPGTLAGPEFAGSLTFVTFTLPMCVMAFLGSAAAAAVRPRRGRRSD